MTATQEDWETFVAWLVWRGYPEASPSRRAPFDPMFEAVLKPILKEMLANKWVEQHKATCSEETCLKLLGPTWLDKQLKHYAFTEAGREHFAPIVMQKILKEAD